jgi:hypothetical protein
MTAGSSLFTRPQAALGHLVKPGGGLSGEIFDLRKDLTTEFAAMAAIAVEEFTNAAAPDAAGLLALTATTVAVQTVLTAGLLAPGKAALAAYPRNVTFTTDAAGTPGDAPADAVVTGTDINGEALTETISVPQTATTTQGAKAFKTITSIVYAAGDGTGAQVSIGFGKKFGLTKKIKSRAGLATAIKEIAVGAVVTTGTFVDAATAPPNGTYAPSADPDATKDYAIYYEFDASVK